MIIRKLISKAIARKFACQPLSHKWSRIITLIFFFHDSASMRIFQDTGSHLLSTASVLFFVGFFFLVFVNCISVVIILGGKWRSFLFTFSTVLNSQLPFLTGCHLKLESIVCPVNLPYRWRRGDGFIPFPSTALASLMFITILNYV